MTNILLRAFMALNSLAALPASDFADADLDARIRTLRQREAALPTTATGPVRYELLRHAFPFGTCVEATAMDAAWTKPGQSITEEDRQRYSAIVSRHFTAAVAGNEHKWYGMETASGAQQADRARLVMDWCATRELRMRGHCVWWGVPKYQPDWMKDLPADQVEPRMRRRLAQVVEVFRGRITEWDLMNELTDQDLFAKKTGLKPADYFRWAVEAEPGWTWFVNEFGPLQYGTEAAIGKVETLMRELKAAGARVDGLGDQAHFFKAAPSAADLWRILDRLGAFGVPVVLTELDVAWKSMTPDDQADSLRRIVRTAYAHPAVHGIYLWGFWQGLMWRKDAALWNQDWSIRPAGQAWVDLLSREWTSTGEATPVDGVLRFRGFPGTYRLTWSGGSATANLAQ